MTCDLVTLYLTADSEDVAVHISTALVKERLVACANVNPGTRSIFEWGGVLQLENEITVFMKTTKERANAAIRRAREIHTYDTPCITVLPVIDADPDYVIWVHKQVNQPIHETKEFD